MPCRGQECGFTLGAHGAEEVDRLMVGIGEPHRHYLMPYTHIQPAGYDARYVKLLKSHLAALLYLGFILAVFGVLNFISRAGAARFKLDFSTEHPLGIEFIVKRKDKSRNRYRIAVFACRAILLKAVYTIILERCHNLTVTAEAELVVTVDCG